MSALRVLVLGLIAMMALAMLVAPTSAFESEDVATEFVELDAEMLSEAELEALSEITEGAEMMTEAEMESEMEMEEIPDLAEDVLEMEEPAAELPPISAEQAAEQATAEIATPASEEPAPDMVLPPMVGAAPVTYTYNQRTGIFVFPNGRRVQCYSGKGAGFLNNPAAQCTPNKGPLPRGRYTIGPQHTHRTCGPVSYRLEPKAGTAMCGRAGFLIHGGNMVTKASSQGCIIMPVGDRRTIVRGSTLNVVQ